MAKKDILGLKSVAYASCCGGIEVKDIEYGIDDYLVYVSGAWCGKPSPHRTKIYTAADGRAYVVCHGYRIYMDECIRMEV